MEDLKLIEKEVANLEKRMSLPNDFVLSILNEDDDWAFITKLHSLIETVLGQLIVKAVAKKELENEIFKLNYRTKLSMTRDLRFIDKNISIYLNDLSRIRNQYIHNIKNVGHNLLGISQEAKIGTFMKYSNNNKLRLFIWGMSVLVLSELNKYINIEDSKIEMNEIEKILGKLKIKEIREAAKGDSTKT